MLYDIYFMKLLILVVHKESIVSLNLLIKLSRRIILLIVIDRLMKPHCISQNPHFWASEFPLEQIVLKSIVKLTTI